LDAHGEVLEAIRMRRNARNARVGMQALLDIATADLLRLSETGSSGISTGIRAT
jgi:hypothetical protein